jgi:hypothetical protein
MAGHYSIDDAAASGTPKAMLLCGESEPDNENLAGLLDCLGASWQTVSVRELARGNECDALRSEERFCIITTASCLAGFIERAANGGGELPNWLTKAESVYVYGFGEDDPSQRLLRFLTGDARSNVRNMIAERTTISVSTDFPELCGPMCGLQFQVRTLDKQAAFDLPARSASSQSIVSCYQGRLLVAVNCRGARLFLSSAADVVDVRARCTKYFDVRESFFETVPIVMYAKWAFGMNAPAAMNGCLIVDDPPLKPRYGFLKYRDIVRLMDEHNFSTTIAFIPWNWHRTDARTVQLFHERPDKLSLCVHGCDHTGGEFAERSTAVLNKRIAIANQRMQLLRRKTGLHHSDVMLFPQGAFSAGAARALKLNGFIAAANTEVAPAHADENKTTIADLFSLAIKSYGSFPIFTRRYLSHGVENFAFDGILGKPCLIGAHHDDFAGGARILLRVIAKLNSSNWKLRWRSLGDTITRSFNLRKLNGGDPCVEMYGSNLIYANSHASNTGVTFIKEESDFECVKAVTVSGSPVDHVYNSGYLQFKVSVPPQESADVRIVYSGGYSGGQNLSSVQDGVKYRAKALLRRYLSEFRDNYLSRNPHLQQSALKIKEALRL